METTSYERSDNDQQRNGTAAVIAWLVVGKACRSIRVLLVVKVLVVRRKYPASISTPLLAVGKSTAAPDLGCAIAAQSVNRQIAPKSKVETW